MILQPVILAGGSGTRLWPSSRKHHAKQFLVLANEMTMLQQTMKRLSNIPGQSPLVICNEEARFLAAEQMRQINCLDMNNASLLLEPEGRNTAPAIALAALEASALKDDPVLLVMPADHQIKDKKSFGLVVKAASHLATSGNLVMFGIQPTKPETGYGYIRCGKKIPQSEAFAAEAFIEKPDDKAAHGFLHSGEYLWNSGIFMFRASRFLEELGKFCPDVLSACKNAFKEKAIDGQFLRFGREEFLASPDISIDYAIMEKSTSSVVVPLDAGWSDVGSWRSIWEASPKDTENNFEVGDVINMNGSGNYINAENRLVATIGLENMVIIETKDVVFVAPRDKADEVKSLVETLTSRGRVEVDIHRDVYRPWGKYDRIDSGKQYQVKRITVNPGAKLSLQKHLHRAEHWIVVKGKALVTKGDETTVLSENQSTYIPIGEVHQLENPGEKPLELIEVQSGNYLAEDDIVRLKDKYGRQ